MAQVMGTMAHFGAVKIFVDNKRKYHFKSIKLLGSEVAIKEPKRVALSMLFNKYTFDEILKH